jgi:hypothetical protein
MPELVPAHLHPEITDHGHATMPAIEGTYGGFAEASESTSSRGPCLWLRVQGDMNGHGACVHLAADDAWRLADQLRTLVRNHYQGDSTPEWAVENA